MLFLGVNGDALLPERPGIRRNHGASTPDMVAVEIHVEEN